MFLGKSLWVIFAFSVSSLKYLKLKAGKSIRSKQKDKGFKYRIMETAHALGDLHQIENFTLKKSCLRCQFNRKTKQGSFGFSTLGFIRGVYDTVHSYMEQMPFPYFEDVVA